MEIKKLLDCMKNPVKSQIIISLQRKSILTAKELLCDNDSIPQATLYRTLKKLEEDKLITVVSQRQKRGTIEKSYQLADSLSNMNQSIISQNDGELYANMFSNFVTELLSEFNEYSKSESINIAKDSSGFSAISIYATPEELMKYGEEIKKILEPSFKRRNSQQEIHTFATIITPPRKENLQNEKGKEENDI